MNLNIKIIKLVYELKGRLSWNYRPFRNYKISTDLYYFRNKFYTFDDLSKELIQGAKFAQITTNFNVYRDLDTYPNGISENESNPVLYPKGSIVDFNTDKLDFDLKHPVNILPLYSYDGSVNLILNDGKNQPKLINSRFSPTEMGLYQVIERTGKSTNIYSEDSFDLDTSLYKNYIKIPKIIFTKVSDSGTLPIGNYHFYFKYVDDDGNETDFIGESGLISLFKGFSKKVVNTGFRNENSNKSILFNIDNIDIGYSYINVYYTRSTADINENSTISAYKITEKFPVKAGYYCPILINGTLSLLEISIDELNTSYYMASSIKTLATCLNRLFIGNVSNPEINYTELADLSLRFIPTIDSTVYYNNTDTTYTDSPSNTYVDPKFIYDYTGYLAGEIYRLGIVYILNDNSLTPVFNIRGSYNCKEYTLFKVMQSGERNYIKYDEVSGIIEDSNVELENAYGVIKIKDDILELRSIIGIKIELQDTTVLQKLKSLNIKGYFFVRLKRIPTRICQAFTIGMVNVGDNMAIPAPYTKIGNKLLYLVESFHNTLDELILKFEDRIHTEDSCEYIGAICPEYDINYPYLNSLFCGDDYFIKISSSKTPFIRLDRHLTASFTSSKLDELYPVKILGIEDNVKLVELEDKIYFGRAGDTENDKFYPTDEDKDWHVRGSFGPYLAISGFTEAGRLIDIYPKSIASLTNKDYFNIRVLDHSPYYAISDRYTLTEYADKTYYRGDSYICMFTHRLNRNFLDSTDPINDTIVNYKSWKERHNKIDGKELGINIGDLNAMQLGIWCTFPVISNYNLNIRSLDNSNVDEKAVTGRARGFYPYYEAIPSGNMKIPEALCYNKGFQNAVSNKYYFTSPNVPSIKNDFTNRIYYSDINVLDAYKNGFRTFKSVNYRDYSKEYGSIIKLIEFGGNLLCVFEHGIGIVSVNERVVSGEGSGGEVFINTNNVLSLSLSVISDMYGSQWADSVIKTPNNTIYGVDTVAKVIWEYSTSRGFQVISNMEILEFLNNNLNLSELENTPIIGVRNVKTHYNAFKNDVMFTFYNCLKGFTETSWNICFNELLNKWITFYSWIPSFSENIDKQFFTFDRNTSKWITKLGISKTSYALADGIVISNNIISSTSRVNGAIGRLSIVNRLYPKNAKITFTIEHDIFGNWKKFSILDNKLILNTDYSDLCSEIYQRGIINSDGLYITKLSEINKSNFKEWENNCLYKNNYVVCQDEYGRNKMLDEPYNATNIVILLNIKATISIDLEDKKLYKDFLGELLIDTNYLSTTIALIPKYNLLFLTTNFWKHGLAGIINIADEIRPCNWYGKLHPFEFEFIVNDKPQYHKIFDNLQIIGNNAEPESFHYEVIGDSYEFAKDKKNMYIRQEATKNLYQYNNCDITYDSDYINLQESHRTIENSGKFDKSTILPLYYSRLDTINEIEDSYHLKGDVSQKDFSALSGSEIVRYKKRDEYRIWEHSKAINMQTSRMRGNMLYLEDKWRVQINPINFVQKNESDWRKEDLLKRLNLSNKIPIELNLSPIPNEILQLNSIEIPEELKNRAIVKWNWEDSQNKEAKLKDKYVKIRIRYTGNKLALIYAINTLYRISYS